jgi:hemolysin activation/secretion protein
VGTIWNDDEIVSDLKRSSLASAGVGVRTDLSDTFSVEGVAAFPLTRDVETRGSTDPRYFFSVSASF